ncbi:MAG: oxidoreductase [Leptolyngbya foveolarum]|uniref:Oxidoreductase n=1 Tax=Leptolyngbya foveolarum TaxID=47253 RepID=A0A2W4TY37_9CYAN|nr:MAG: oxidoreductase [Leptolyngbya foveolarum]
MASLSFPVLSIAPAQVIRGSGVLASSAKLFARFGKRPLLIGGDRTLTIAMPFLSEPLSDLAVDQSAYQQDCSELAIAALHQSADEHSADFIIGVGGGKALDAAKLLAYQRQLPIVTVPTSAATCAGWTALSNVYSEAGAFLYDVGLPGCPDAIVLDYDLVATAPERTLIAGIGDAIAKWYEASVSSGQSSQTMVIGAVQQARVLRDILFQKSASALKHPGSDDWREVVDAAVLMAGVIGGMGGAVCRTVAAHAVHNGLTHVSTTGLAAPGETLHGEKVAYGILVQLRLEEMGTGSALAATARTQLLHFYRQIGLPTSLADLGLASLSVNQLQQAATIACRPGSDIHHLPFSVQPEQVMAAMVSTTVAMNLGTSAKLSNSEILAKKTVANKTA